VIVLENNKPIPFFSYETKETAEKKDAEKIMIKIIKNALRKTQNNL